MINISLLKRLSPKIDKKQIKIFVYFCKTRSRIQQASRGKTKSSSTINILGIDNITYRKRIEQQMTTDMTWDNAEIDHVKPIYLFDVSDKDELKEAFTWKSTQPF